MAVLLILRTLRVCLIACMRPGLHLEIQGTTVWLPARWFRPSSSDAIFYIKLGPSGTAESTFAPEPGMSYAGARVHTGCLFSAGTESGHPPRDHP